MEMVNVALVYMFCPIHIYQIIVNAVCSARVYLKLDILWLIHSRLERSFHVEHSLGLLQ